MITLDTIHIQAFGGIADRTIALTKGLNLLRGDNESGKSTLLAFLRYMLYGFPSSAEKKRLRPLDGSIPAGTLTLTKDGESYRIHRRTPASGRDQVQVVRLRDGAEEAPGMEPGEFFLGIPSDLFDQTALIRQGEGGAVDGKKLAQSINNLLTSADETVSVEKAQAHLDKMRVELWHMNRRGGAIAEKTAQLSSLRERLGDAIRGAQDIAELDAAITEKKKTLAAHKTGAQTFHLQLLAHQLAMRREKEAMLDARLQTWQDAQHALRSARESGLPSGFVPSEAYRAELQDADRALREAEREVADAEHALSVFDVADERDGQEIAACFASLGGIEATLAAVRNGIKKSKRLRLLGILLAVLLIGLLLLFLSAKEKKRVDAILARFGCKSEEELHALAARQSAKQRLTDREREVLCRKLEQAREKRQTLAAHAESIARIAGGSVSEVLAALGAYEERLIALTSELREAKASYESTKALLDNEPPIETDGMELPALPPNFDAADASRKHRFFRDAIPMLEKQIHAQQIHLAELNAKREDPAALADALAEGEKELAALHAEYEAVELALDCLADASAGMRGSVTLHLAELASSSLSRMTGGRYTRAQVDDAYELRTPHPDYDGAAVSLGYLSEGTRAQAYLSLRIALTDLLCGQTLPPLLLDEALVFLDDNRLAQVLSLLREMGEKRQILLFTASAREQRILNLEPIPVK